MKKLHRLFQEAERLQPAPELWRRIEARSMLISRSPTGAWTLVERPFLRVAAAVLLAAGVLGLAGLGMSRHRSAESERVAERDAASAPATVAVDSAAEIFDPDLMGWQANLGEVDLEADPAEEML